MSIFILISLNCVLHIMLWCQKLAKCFLNKTILYWCCFSIFPWNQSTFCKNPCECILNSISRPSSHEWYAWDGWNGKFFPPPPPLPFNQASRSVARALLSWLHPCVLALRILRTRAHLWHQPTLLSACTLVHSAHLIATSLVLRAEPLPPAWLSKRPCCVCVCIIY